MIVVELYNDVFDVEVSSSSLEVSVSQEAQVLDATVLKDTDALLQEKVVSINKNGETVITPDDGFDGMKAVKVDANIDPLSQCGYAEFDFVTDRGNNNSIWRRIKRLNASCWDTSQFTSMANVFTDCTSLTTLDVSGWDTSKVTNMYWMFVRCASLTTLDVSGWDTSNVTNMTNLFNVCTSLTTLDMSGWDTSKVTNMYGMFYRCTSLKSIIGEKSLEDVENGTVALRGTKVVIIIQTPLRFSSILALANGLADLTGKTAQTLTISAQSYNNMYNDDDTVPTSDVIIERQARIAAICAAKNWNFAH